MDKKKKIILGASIGGASILVLGLGLGLGFGITAKQKNDLIKKESAKYRIEYTNEIYKRIKNETISNSNNFPNGWLPEYDQLLKEWSTNPYKVDTSKKWYEDWEPFNIPKGWHGSDGKYYLSWANNLADFPDIFNDGYSKNSLIANVKENNNFYTIGFCDFGIRLWLDSSTEENPDPFVAQLTISNSNPIIINKI